MGRLEDLQIWATRELAALEEQGSSLHKDEGRFHKDTFTLDADAFAPLFANDSSTTRVLCKGASTRGGLEVDAQILQPMQGCEHEGLMDFPVKSSPPDLHKKSSRDSERMMFLCSSASSMIPIHDRTTSLPEEQAGYSVATNHTGSGSLRKFKLWPAWEQQDDKSKCYSLFFTERACNPATVKTSSILSHGRFSAVRHLYTNSVNAFGSTLSPTSPVCVFWDSAFALVITYDFVVLPVHICFDIGEDAFLTLAAWFTRMFWTISIPLNFVTGYVTTDGMVEHRLGRIFYNYLASWGIFDVLVVVSDWMEIVLEGTWSVSVAKGLRIVRIVRALKFLKVLRLPTELAKIKTRAYFEQAGLSIKVAKIFLAFFGLLHLIACVWFAVGNRSDGWVTRYHYMGDGVRVQYAVSMHWTISQIIGNCDIYPMGARERWYTVLVLLLCLFVSTCFTSEVTASLTRLSVISGHQSRQFSILRQYLNYNKISSGLSGRVLMSAKFRFAQRAKDLPACEVELLQIISDPMLAEINYEVNAPVLTQHLFFHRYNAECPIAMHKICHSCLSNLTLSVGDVLFTEGERSQTNPKMYFIVAGSSQYYQSGTESPEIISKGWICEMALWVAWRHRGTMRASSFATFAALNALEFQQIACEFRDPIFYPALYAARVLAVLNREVEDVSMRVDDVHDSGLDIANILDSVFPEMKRRSLLNKRARLKSRLPSFFN